MQMKKYSRLLQVKLFSTTSEHSAFRKCQQYLDKRRAQEPLIPHENIQNDDGDLLDDKAMQYNDSDKSTQTKEIMMDYNNMRATLLFTILEVQNQFQKNMLHVSQRQPNEDLSKWKLRGMSTCC